MKGVNPITEEAKMHDGDEAAEERPSHGQPCLQHPADGGAHTGAGDEQTEPGTLRWKVHGHVGGLHGDVDAFKVGPHGRGGIGETAMGECVCREEEAEVVRDER